MQIQHTNMQVANVTTPANYFHVLRRQVHRNFRKPLVIATPKSLLRHKSAVSRLEDMAEGSAFQRFIPDTHTALVAPKKVRKLLLCSGKVYYELEKHREEAGAHDVAIARLEQIAPFPFDKVAEEIKKFPAASVTWVQEEPRNMGAWFYVNPRIESATRVALNKEVRPVSPRCCTGAAVVRDAAGVTDGDRSAGHCPAHAAATFPAIGRFRLSAFPAPSSSASLAVVRGPPGSRLPRGGLLQDPRRRAGQGHCRRLRMSCARLTGCQSASSAAQCNRHCCCRGCLAARRLALLPAHAIALSAVLAEPWSAAVQQLETRWIPSGGASGLSRISLVTANVAVRNRNVVSIPRLKPMANRCHHCESERMLFSSKDPTPW